MSKAPGKAPDHRANVADQVAEFIGRTMGELLNRKGTLTKQMAEVDRQISEVRQRVVRQFGEYLPDRSPAPARRRRGRGRKAASRSTSSSESVAGARVVTDETRQKMAEAARKRWARERAKKPKGAKTR